MIWGPVREGYKVRFDFGPRRGRIQGKREALTGSSIGLQRIAIRKVHRMFRHLLEDSVESPPTGSKDVGSRRNHRVHRPILKGELCSGEYESRLAATEGAFHDLQVAWRAWKCGKPWSSKNMTMAIPKKRLIVGQRDLCSLREAGT